ncbi:MAG TPA: orotidine 5'-phosphate decarboxylase, partial [Rhizobiaceae bacterium]|nr:orotidine 5'-phosphate decarboxylase [Rhizobiaceae bacterium]
MNAVPGNALSDRLIVALDVPDILTAAGIVERLGDSVSFYKIGYQLVYSGGLPLVRDLAAAGKKVFLDLKLLDIDNTMEKGVEAVTRLGATMLTVHAYPKAMQAAVKAA